MSPVLPRPPAPTIQAGILILAQELARALGVRPETVAEICEVTGVSRSQAYEMRTRIESALDDLHRRPGRPPRETSASANLELLVVIRDFLMDHPGCVEDRDSRRVYHTNYRDFVLRQMCPPGPAANLTHEQVAEIFGVPLGTLKDWLSDGRSASRAATEPAEPSGAGTGDDLMASFEVVDPLIALILGSYPRWKGSFGGFCRFLKNECRFPYGSDFVRSILEMAGLRRPVRRKRSVRPWSRDTFRTLFPGAQWIGDGKTVVITWQGERMAFNFEAIVDPASQALVGAVITDTEDEAAVLAALDHARATTSDDPLAVTLDLRSSNHTDGVREAVAPGELLESTKARPTAKAPVEGTFGLFSQTAPSLSVTGDTPRELARSALKLYVVGWAWARNGRPRARLGGRTPADVYQRARPTQDQVDDAKAWIAALRDRQEKIRRTREAKADPVRRQLIVEALEQLGIPDPSGRLAVTIASCWSQEAIVRGIATYRAKLQMGTIPADADRGPYLAAIIRNIHEELEELAFADALLEIRLRQRDVSLRPLEQDLERILGANPLPSQRVRVLLDRALEAPGLIDSRFWIARLRETFVELPAFLARTLYKSLTERISRAYKTPRDRRRDIIATLSAAATVASG